METTAQRHVRSIGQSPVDDAGHHDPVNYSRRLELGM